ncbi:DUF6894 family protein [Methylobacterium sp. P31]
MIVVLLATLVTGIFVLAVTWPKLGLFALALAPVASSLAALLSGLLFAFLRRNEFRNGRNLFNPPNFTAAESEANKKLLEPDTRRFYFDIEKIQRIICDDLGVESDNLDLALDEARSVIQEMVDEVASGHPGEMLVLVVRDESGSSVARLPIEKALSQMQAHQRSA